MIRSIIIVGHCYKTLSFWSGHTKKGKRTLKKNKDCFQGFLNGDPVVSIHLVQDVSPRGIKKLRALLRKNHFAPQETLLLLQGESTAKKILVGKSQKFYHFKKGWGYIVTLPRITRRYINQLVADLQCPPKLEVLI